MPRAAVLAPVLLLAAAACADGPTAPDRPALAGSPRMSVDSGVSAPAGRVVVSAPVTLAFVPGAYDVLTAVSAGRVEWMERYGIPEATVMKGLDLATRTVTVYRREDQWMVAGPVAAGPFTLWGAPDGWFRVRDARTGVVTTYGYGNNPYVSSTGRVVYETRAGLVAQDAIDAEPTVVAPRENTSGFGWPGVETSLDGDIVVWAMQGPFTTVNSLAYADVATGERRLLGFARRRPAVNAGRIAWVEPSNGGATLRLYDVATHTARSLEAAPGAGDVAFSGDLVAWNDNRDVQETCRTPCDDVYAYDLVTRTEFPVATGSSNQTAVSVDADRIVWAERVPGGWEVRMATARRLIGESDLSSLVQRMASTGEIRDGATAQALAALLADAARAHDGGDAAKERDALIALRDRAQRCAGRQIDAAAASRLAGMVNAMLPNLGAGVEGPGVTGGGTLAGR